MNFSKRSNTFTIKSQAIPPPPPGCPPPNQIANQRYFLASHHDLERNQNNNNITSSTPKRKKQCQRVHSANASFPARIHSATQAHSASANLPTKNIYQIIAKTISTQTIPVTEHKSVNTDDQIDNIEDFIPEFMTPSFGPQRSGE